MPSHSSRRRFAPAVERAEARLLLSTATLTDNRVPVADTTAYPYDAVVRLWVTMPDGDEFAVSGAMIDSTHVLTAAHCIYSARDGGWATSVLVMPGQSGSTIPLGTYQAVRETLYTDYTTKDFDAEGFKLDVALLRLDTPVVSAVEALGQAVEPDAFFKGAPLDSSGYPGDLPAGTELKGQVMYTATGKSTHADSHIVYNTIPIAGGQSGSALYMTDSTGTYIVGVLSFGHLIANDNGAVRLTPVVAADLRTWGEVDSVDDPSTVFAHAALPHDPTTFRVTTPYTPQGLMHVMTI
jgi:V8-like Glu-specific endopeptidase